MSKFVTKRSDIIWDDDPRFVEDYSPDQPRHPKGAPASLGGQFAPGSGLPSYTTNPDEVYDIRQDLSKPTREDPRQPVQTIDELYDIAKQEEDHFMGTVESIAKRTGGTARFAPLKDSEPGTRGLKRRSSSERKIRDELDGDASRVLDVARGTVLFDTVAEARLGLVKFKKEQGDNIVRLKDRIFNPIEAGYRDFLVNIKTPRGMIAEIQFNTKNMLQTKESAGHDLYETLRTLSVGDPRAASIKNDVLQKSRIMYNEAYEKDGNHKGW